MKIEFVVSDSLFQNYCAWAAKKGYEPYTAIRVQMRTVARDDDVPTVLHESPMFSKIRALFVAKSPQSISGIYLNAGYSKAAVNMAVERFRLLGDIERCQEKRQTAGKPAYLYQITSVGAQRHRARVERGIAFDIKPAAVLEPKPFEEEWVDKVNFAKYLPDHLIGNDSGVCQAHTEVSAEFYKPFHRKLGRERTNEIIELIEKRFWDYNARRGIELLAMRAAQKEGV